MGISENEKNEKGKSEQAKSENSTTHRVCVQTPAVLPIPLLSDRPFSDPPNLLSCYTSDPPNPPSPAPSPLLGLGAASPVWCRTSPQSFSADLLNVGGQFLANLNSSNVHIFRKSC